MRLQDKLQADIDKLREQEAQERAQRGEEEAFYSSRLLQPMLNAQAYFNELVNKLSVLEPDITVNYPLDPHLPDGVPLRQSKYRVLPDNSEHPHRIDVLCSCTLSEPCEFYIPGEQSARNRTRILDTYGLHYHRKNRLDNFFNVCGVTFILEGPLIARMRITANAATQHIHVEVRNFFPDPEPRNYQFSPEEFGEELLDTMAKFMLRQIPHMVERKVGDDLRSRLRNQLETDEFNRQRDLELARREREAEELARQQATFRYRAGQRMAQARVEAGRILSEARKRLDRWRRNGKG